VRRQRDAAPDTVVGVLRVKAAGALEPRVDTPTVTRAVQAAFADNGPVTATDGRTSGRGSRA
jgi:hypothetical protein